MIQPQDEPKADRHNSLFCDLNATGGDFDFYTYPLTMECTLTSQGLKVNAHFDSKSIHLKQIRRFVNQFVHIVQQFSGSELDMRVRDIEIISPQDKKELSEWNRKYPETVDTCVHQLIEKIVHEQPTMLAIASWDGNMSRSQRGEQGEGMAWRGKGMSQW